MAFNLEAEMGLRRIELKRMRLQDIKNGYLAIHGKGHKWRTIPVHPYFPVTYQEWSDHREILIENAMKYNPTVEVPSELLIWQRYGKLGAYKSRNSLRVWDAVSKRVGFHISHHTMRRSFGRSMWELLGDKCLLRLSEIYGHSDIKQTIKYIQVELKHMKDTIEEYHQKMYLRPTIQSR
jgi:site-specific recombinase XerC